MKTPDKDQKKIAVGILIISAITSIFSTRFVTAQYLKLTQQSLL